MYSNWSYSPKTPNLGQIRRFLEPCDLEIWRMTLKNNRAPLLCCFQLCAWFHCHMWIQTGVRVRKRLSWVLISVTFTFDLWPWPFAWTSLLTMVITPENFIMIRWWEHGEKGVTDLIIEEVPYCFWRSSVKFQGHTALKNVEFDPDWAFPDCNSSLNSPMATKCCTKLEVA